MTETEKLSGLPAFRDLPRDTLKALMSISDKLTLGRPRREGRSRYD